MLAQVSSNRFLMFMAVFGVIGLQVNAVESSVWPRIVWVCHFPAKPGEAWFELENIERDCETYTPVPVGIVINHHKPGVFLFLDSSESSRK